MKVQNPICSAKDRYLPWPVYVSNSKKEQVNYYFHKHDDFCEIIFLEKGSGVIFIDNQKYDLCAGDFAIINHSVIHAEFYEPDVAYERSCIGITNVMLNGLEENNIIPNLVCPVIRKNPKSAEMEYIFKKVIEEVTEKNVGYIQASKSLLLALFAYIRRNISLDAPQYQTDTDEIGLAFLIKDYMDQNYRSHIPLKSLAAVFHISPYYLSHIIKDAFGLSPMRYMMNLRIGEAQQLLLTTDDTVTSIAEQVGYDNPYYFIDLFKRNTGMTPNEYRKSAAVENHAGEINRNAIWDSELTQPK